MKKQIFAGFAAILLNTLSAQASISFDMRTDYLSSQYDKTSSSADSNQFKLKVARVDAKGKLNESVDYRLRFRVSSNRTVSTKDNLGGDTDFAYITNKLNPNLTLTIGKFGSDAGGIENQAPSPDLYLESMQYTEADSTFTNNSLSAFRYYTGAKLAYSFEGGELALHVTNLSSNSTGPGNNGTAGQFDQNKNMTGLVYKGSFMDKKLMPILSYHTQSGNAAGAGQNDDKSKNTYLAAGIKYDFEPFSVEADYMSNVLGSLTTIDQNDKLDTFLAGFAYTMDQWTGRLKIENSVAKKATSATAETKSTYNGYQVAIEYKPAKDDIFRYHVAYWSRENKQTTATTTVTTTDKFTVAGVRIAADFLK